MKETADSEETHGRRGTRMADIAAMAGVSSMTVSRVLRDRSCVMPATLSRIEAAIDATGYVPNRVAGSLASRRTDIVGLIVPSLRNSLFAETIKGVSDILGPMHPLMIADSGYSLKGEEIAIRAFLGQRVCGIILHNTKHSPRGRAMLLEAGIPCIETGNLAQQPIDMAVGFSNRDAASAMTMYLLGRGYRHIGFVCLPTKDNDRAAERKAGYLNALSHASLLADPRIVIESPPGLKSGGQALSYLVEVVPEIDAVFFSGDVLATGALLEANRRGWIVPDRIAIAGSDDSELQESVSPPLTTLRFPRYEIGRRAADMLLNRLSGRSSGRAIVDLGFEIIRRASA
ncbi:LacI family DNA-binding transcriptional regulator [Acidisphaera sp. S103]|uniref:LacI family DNA-binding transcriptional regulator n=1 Tax=Acidisphaera sp. S103 TaxID=1747223 RepID=UPI00131E9421|nr:LacI family DNA-binding transcriptional regulator [Acidisphaera sp. S103]